jgi:HEAT repeat protein
MEVLVDADRNLRRAAAESLGAIGDPQAVPPLLLALEDEHWSVRCAAAGALGRIRSGKSLPALLARLQDDDQTVRRAAVAALGELGDTRAAGRLVAALQDAGLQGAALEALRRMGSAALGELEKAFAGATAEARRLIVDLAGRMEDPHARRLLLAALADDSAQVRTEAALALGDGGFLEAVPPLMDVKASDPSPAVRQAAARALKKLAPRS